MRQDGCQYLPRVQGAVRGQVSSAFATLPAHDRDGGRNEGLNEALRRARRRRREASYWYKSKAETKIAPSTTTGSIAGTMSSPVPWGGRLGTLCHGRFDGLAS